MTNDKHIRSKKKESSVAAGARKITLSLLGSRLRLSRVTSRLTQNDVANQLGITPQTLRNWESGKYEPPPSAVTTLAIIYGLSREDLLSDTTPIMSIHDFLPRASPDVKVPVVPDKLAEARKRAKLTQAQVSVLTGLSLNTIRRYENGSSNPAPDTLLTMAKAYDEPVAWFLPQPDAQSLDDLVISMYSKVKPHLSDEDKLRILSIMRNNHDLNTPGRSRTYNTIPGATSNLPEPSATDVVLYDGS